MDREQAKTLLLAVGDWKEEATEFLPNDGPFHSETDIATLGRITDLLAHWCDSGIISIDPTPLIEFYEACDRTRRKTWKQVDDGPPSSESLRHLYDQAFRVVMRIEKLAWRDFSDLFVGGRNSEPQDDGPVPPHGFRWKETVHTDIRALLYRLLEALWSAPRNTLSFADLALKVWDDHAAEHKMDTLLPGLLSNANAFFQSRAIPLLVRRSRRTKNVWIDRGESEKTGK